MTALQFHKEFNNQFSKFKSSKSRSEKSKSALLEMLSQLNNLRKAEGITPLTLKYLQS